MDKFIGKRLDGRYEIREAIGHGGMAVVYKAHDNIENRTVAVKILRDEYLKNEEFRRRFKNESKVIAVLNHKNVVDVYDVSFGDVIQYIVMEYVEGVTLKNYINQNPHISTEQALNFTIQILRALAHAHEKGIIHRDIKPQNIILVDGQTVKVTDFGISRFSRSDQKTMTDKAIGSVHYISPEQAKCEQTDAKSDLYSVGVLMYEMLCGTLPFEADSAVSVALMQLQNEPKPMHQLNPNIPLGLEQIVMRAMAKDPYRRYQTADDMLKDIAEFQKNPEIIFDHSYFNDEQATKYIPDLDTKSEEVVQKPTITPIYIGIGIAILFALVAIIFGLVWWLGGDPGETFNTPNFIYDTEDFIEVELTIGDDRGNRRIIQDELRELGVSFRSIEFFEMQPNDETPRGEIGAQTPEPGTPTRSGATLRLGISPGPATLRMPNLVGNALRDAEIELEDLGIGFEVEMVFDENVPQGMVISTDPPAGASVAATGQVRIFVSDGPVPREVEVPNLVRRSEASARDALERRALELGSVTEDYHTEIGAGFVISQAISAGVFVEAGTVINIVVSRGAPAPTSVADRFEGDLRITFDDRMNHWVEDFRVTLNGEQIHRDSSGFDLRTTTRNRTVRISTSERTSTVRVYLNNLIYQQIRVTFNDRGNISTTIEQNHWQRFVHPDAPSETPQSLPPQSLPPYPGPQ